MAIRPSGSTQKQNIYIHMSTKNQSFLDMHYYLRDRGIKNNNFFLILLDKDLVGIDPRDPHLNSFMKRKILRECIFNYWYFIREVVRIPTQGNTSGDIYKLHRGNLAINFGFIKNWNTFSCLPRQTGKTIGFVINYLWAFNFGTTNSEIMMINKKHEDSKLNLARLKEIRAALPSYLRMDSPYSNDGKKLKVTDTVEILEHPTNSNRIRTMASARNRVAANGLGRGLTQPMQWYDEYAFIPFVGIIYLSATPAFKTAAMNAKRNGGKYGLSITTTPGSLSEESGLDAYQTKEDATPFDEIFYDMTDAQLQELLSKNTNSAFVYMEFSYQQLGRDEQWFKEICIDMKKNWSAIRREVLLEWSRASDNSPFKKEDLNIVKDLIKEPISKLKVFNYYQFNIYEQINLRYPPIIGVDVSGGFKRDGSAITIIDSKTTKVCATFNCNYISVDDLGNVIYELVTKYMPNAVVNIERNGGFGSSIVSRLMKTNIKKNLYYEIKDRVIEERFVNGVSHKSKQRTKVYGLDSSKAIRNDLMEILNERMRYHKDKFICGHIYDELVGLEVKRNGKVEHSSNTHDDQIFSYLMALYVWYEGKNLMEVYGIEKSSIRSDQVIEDALTSLEDQFTDISEDIANDDDDLVQDQLNAIEDNTMLYSEFRQQQYEEDQRAIDQLMSNRVSAQAYVEKYNLDPSLASRSGSMKIPDDVFENFYE